MKFKVALLALFVSLLSAPSAHAEVKAGSICKNAGATQVASGNTYSCVKLGKKLQWKKISAGFVPPTVPTSWNDLEANYKGIAYGAWKKVNEKVTSSKSSQNKIIVMVGPNSKPLNDKLQGSIDLTSRLYAGFSAPSTTYAIYFTFKDVAWAQKELDRLTNNDPNVVGEVEHSCASASDCVGASARLTPTGDGILLLSVSGGAKDSNHSTGTLESHEYTHTIQDTQFLKSGRSWDNLPRWYVEGHAEFSQAATIFFSDFQNYQLERNRNTGELFQKSSYFTPSWLEEFIAPKGWTTGWQPWNSGPGWRVYDVGSLVTEVLVALKGPDSTLDLYKQVATGKTFSEGFNTVYGKPWSEAAPLIAKVINLQLKA